MQRQASDKSEAQATPQERIRRVHPRLKRDYPSAKVVEDESCVLIQVNLENNNNKFYVMQVFESEGEFDLFIHYGRVGVGKGKVDYVKNKKKIKCHEDATKAYNDQFEKETGKDSKQKKEFAFDHYTLLEMDEEDDWERTLGKEYTPLGKLSQVQIERGQQALREIQDFIRSKVLPETLIEKEIEDKLKELSSKYYTYIPHRFALRKRPDLIKDQAGVDKEKEFLRAMQQTQVENENQAASAEVQSEPVAPEPGSSATVKEEKEVREPKRKRAKKD